MRKRVFTRLNVKRNNLLRKSAKNARLLTMKHALVWKRRRTSARSTDSRTIGKQERLRMSIILALTLCGSVSTHSHRNKRRRWRLFKQNILPVEG